VLLQCVIHVVAVCDTAVVIWIVLELCRRGNYQCVDVNFSVLLQCVRHVVAVCDTAVVIWITMVLCGSGNSVSTCVLERERRCVCVRV